MAALPWEKKGLPTMMDLDRRELISGSALATLTLLAGMPVASAFASSADNSADADASQDDAAQASESVQDDEKGSSGMTLAQLESEAITQASKAGEDTPETRGEVDATRTYTFQNAMDDVVTEFYMYETPADGEEPADKGKNLAGDGLERGEQVSATVTGGFIHTDRETLFTCEYVAGGQTFSHSTMHVEDLLFDKIVYLVGVDGVSSATPLSFGDSNL